MISIFEGNIIFNSEHEIDTKYTNGFLFPKVSLNRIEI